MAAGLHDIIVEEGAPWTMSVYVYQSDGVTPKVLTGWTAKLTIRSDYDSDQLVQITSSAGITITGASGLVKCDLTEAQTLALQVRRAVYDLFIYNGSSVPQKLLYGEVTIFPAVTR